MSGTTPKFRKPATIAGLRRRLLVWYAANRRDLPWRRTSDPYAIWVSEVMLQQTRVAVVEDRFRAFLARFPTIGSLARAREEDVLALWSGLGYYRRARMLHKAAQLVSNKLGGTLPRSAQELRLLPGVGTYTAAAIASIAFGEPVAVVDGNVLRVLCRLMRWDGEKSGAGLKRKAEGLAAELVDPRQPGDFNQAMMELGATVCLPRNPRCAACPLRQGCRTRGEHKTNPKPAMLTREAAYALALRDRPRPARCGAQRAREVLLEQRPPEQSVMPGLWELPSLRDADLPPHQAHMSVRHSIMQVNYRVHIRAVAEEDVEAMTAPGTKRRWVLLEDAAAMALTGLARKVLSRAQLLPNAQRGQ